MSTLLFVVNALAMCFVAFRVGRAVNTFLTWVITKALTYVMGEPPPKDES
jgi:hypothetical protein